MSLTMLQWRFWRDRLIALEINAPDGVIINRIDFKHVYCLFSRKIFVNRRVKEAPRNIVLYVARKDLLDM
jgi:hypothetical protein